MTKQFRLRLAATVAVLAALACSAGAQTPGGESPSTPAEEDLRLLEVVLEETVLSEALAAYAGPSGGTLLPLQAMSELLGIAITTKTSEGLASGFILDERRSFHLDVDRRQVTIGGVQRSFEPVFVRVHQDDVYVDSALLGEWLPVVFDIDLFALRLRIRPREPLPLQLRLERERRIRYWRRQQAVPDPGYPRLRTSYRLWEVPSVDQTLRLSVADESKASFATYATGDLLFLESETYVAGNDDDLLDTVRLTLRRRDPAATIGGPLAATELAFGHVIHPSSGLLTRTSEPLPGFLVTNLPLNRPAEFDRHAFRGNLPPGWDVELYHNSALIDYQQSRPDGQYVFDNVPVLFGMNFFRLVFYGPQGQRREEDHQFLLGESLTLPGRFEYRVVGNVESRARRRASALGTYGISRHLTANAEVALLPTPQGEERYGKLGLRAFWSALFVYGDVVASDGGRAWDGGLQTRILGMNMLLSREGLGRGFVSEAFPALAGGDAMTLRDRFRLDTAIPAWILPRIPLTFELERQRFTSGTTRTVAQNRVSMHYKGLSVTNRALWTVISGQPSRLDASLQLSRYIRRVGVRGELLYTVTPTSLTTANVTVEKSLGSGYRVFANVSRSFLGTGHVYSVGIDKISGKFGAGVNAMRDAQGNAAGNFDLSAGLGREPRQGEWLPDARSRASSGAISARVFLDRNENGHFDSGDQLLPQVGFTINGIERATRTSNAGIAFLPELSPHQPADVAIEARTLDDPQWIAGIPGVRIVPRPGKAVMIDFAVVATAEIEGTVTTMRAGALQGVGGATIELLDAAGKVVQQTATAYDGFYVLTHVRRGPYRIRIVQPESVPISRPYREVEKGLTVTLEHSVVTGVDFTLPHTGTPRETMPSTLAAGQPPPTSAQTPPSPPHDDRAVADADSVVQIGSFSIEANAARQANAVRDIVPDAVIVTEGRFTVVRTTPRTKSDAVALVQKLANRGIQAIVIRAAPSHKTKTTSARGFVVQLGAFSIARNAVDLLRRMTSLSRWRTSIDRRGAFYFVQTTPFLTHEEATAAVAELRRLGFPAIVKETGPGH